VYLILVSKRFDTCICIHVSNLTCVCQYTCQTVQLMTSTSDTRLTGVKMHVSNRLICVQCHTRFKMHVTICSDFCSDIMTVDAFVFIVKKMAESSRLLNENFLTAFLDQSQAPYYTLLGRISVIRMLIIVVN